MLLFKTFLFPAGDKFLPMTDDKQNSAFLEISLDATEVLEAQVHTMDTDLVEVSPSCDQASQF